MKVIIIPLLTHDCILAVVDKLKKGKRDGTPDKSGTPSQDALADETQSSVRNVIWNEEIERLQIKEEELAKVGHTVMYMYQQPLDRINWIKFGLTEGGKLCNAITHFIWANQETERGSDPLHWPFILENKTQKCNVEK